MKEMNFLKMLGNSNNFRHDQKMKFFDKIELIITHPQKFFEKINEEKSIWNLFNFYFIFVFLSITINALFILPEIIKTKLDLPLIYFTFIVVMIILSVLFISLIASLLSFVLYLIYHIFVKIFNGKEDYKKTYKLLYASTPLLIAGLIPFYGTFKLIFYPIMAIAFVDSVYISYVGLIKLQKMSKENAVAVVTICAVLGIILIRIFMNKIVI